MTFIVSHWKTLLLAVAGVLAFAGGYRVGYRRGFSAGYSSGISNAPRCPVVHSEVKVAPSECKASTQVKVVYVPRAVPSVTKDCPPIIIPIPEVTYESESTGKQGGAEASDLVREPEPKSAPPGPGPSVSLGYSPSRWHAAGLVGVGSAGLEVGGALGYRLLGPIELGVYGRVPLHKLDGASGGLSLGVSW